MQRAGRPTKIESDRAFIGKLARTGAGGILHRLGQANGDPLTFIRGQISGHAFVIQLHEALAPQTVRLIGRTLPFSGEAIHAMWSGPLILGHMGNVREVTIENPITFLAPGDVVYHPHHFELGIAYDSTQFREPIGSVYVTGLGRITEGLAQIVAIGRSLQRTGAQSLQLEPWLTA